MLYRFPEKVFIDTAKDLVGQLQRACLLAFEIYNIDLSHIELLWTAGALACALKTISSICQQLPSLPLSKDPAWSIRQSHGARAAVSLLSGSLHMRPSDRAPRLPPEEGCRRYRCHESSDCGP